MTSKRRERQPDLFAAPETAGDAPGRQAPQTALVGVWQRLEGAHGLGKGIHYSRHALVLADLYRRCDGRMDRAETAIRLFFEDAFSPGGSLNPDVGWFKRDLLRYAVRADRLLRAQALRRNDAVDEAAQAITPAEAKAVLRGAPPEAREAIERLKRSMRAPEATP